MERWNQLVKSFHVACYLENSNKKWILIKKIGKITFCVCFNFSFCVWTEHSVCLETLATFWNIFLPSFISSMQYFISDLSKPANQLLWLFKLISYWLEEQMFEFLYPSCSEFTLDFLTLTDLTGMTQEHRTESSDSLGWKGPLEVLPTFLLKLAVLVSAGVEFSSRYLM